MDLIDRYVAAVGRRLPDRLRADVERELKSLILDELDGRAPQGQEYSRDDVVAVLREMGSPQVVAGRYIPSPRYLIGPRLYDTYLLVLGIALGAAAIGTGIGLTIELAAGSLPVGATLAKILSALVSGGISAIGAVTLVFAILERVLPDKEKDALLDAQGKWDPHRLPPVTRPDSSLKISESVIAICFSILAIIIFNVFSSRLGGYYSSAHSWQLLPILNQSALAQYLPYWNTIWVVTIIQHSALLIRGGWSVYSRLVGITVSLFSLFVIVTMLNGPSLLDAEGLASLQGTVSVKKISELGTVLQSLYHVGLVVAVVATCIEIVVKAAHLAKSLVHKVAL